MSRMYSRKKGKSGSHKPMKKVAPWVELSPKEIEALVVKFAKKGQKSAQIGTILRDQYGIPSVKMFTKKTISEVMKNNKTYPKLPEDLFNMLEKAVNLHEHMRKNKKDATSKRGLELTESKVRRLAKFYIRTGVLPADWKYDPEKAKLLVK
ncbi:MAG: 30S ribosomal protein S15 [Candidatus Aenigmarchaeota archaeon]|nr:30S ribosomal protein S15 [Candidatus Aenigmarchaeota archaeon]